MVGDSSSDGYAGLLWNAQYSNRGLEEMFREHKGLLLPRVRVYIPESIEEKGFYEEIIFENNSGLVCDSLWYLIEVGEPPLKLDAAGYFSEAYAKKLEMVWRGFRGDPEIRKDMSKQGLIDLIGRYLDSGPYKKLNGAVFGFKFGKRINRHCCFPIVRIEPGFED